MELKRRNGGPWFRHHPRAAALVALVLVVAITALRFASDDVHEPLTLLFALPIVLLALAFGLRVGFVAALGAVGVLASWVLWRDVDLGLLGWVDRVVPLMLLGVLVGRASDDLVRAEATRVRLAVNQTRQRDAAEIQDGVLQQLAVAKWRMEAGQTDAAADALAEAMEVGQALVAALLDGNAVERSRVRPPE